MTLDEPGTHAVALRPVRRGYLDQQLLDRAPTLADKVRVLEQLGERGCMTHISGDLRVIHQRVQAAACKLNGALDGT